MIDVYFWPSGNGKKITIMREECGLPYTVAQYDVINPNNKLPAGALQDLKPLAS